MTTNGNSSKNNVHNEVETDDSLDITPKCAMPDRSSVDLTVFKRKDKVFMYRTSSNSSSTCSSSHFQNSIRSASSQSDLHVDVSKKKMVMMNGDEATVPSVEEIQAAHTYVDIRDEQDEEMDTLSWRIQKELQEEEIKKISSMAVKRNTKKLCVGEKNNTKELSVNMNQMSFNQVYYFLEPQRRVFPLFPQRRVFPLFPQPPVPSTQTLECVAMRLRMVGDQAELQQQLTNATNELLHLLNLGPLRFAEAFFGIVEQLDSMNLREEIALNCTLSQHLVLACSSSLRMVLDVASRSISHFRGSFIEEQGGWQNHFDIEFVASSVNTPPTNPSNNNYNNNNNNINHNC